MTALAVVLCLLVVDGKLTRFRRNMPSAPLSPVC